MSSTWNNRVSGAFRAGRCRKVVLPPPTWDIPYGWHTVSDQEEGRLDLVSMNEYRDPTFFWVVAMFNSITDPVSGYSAGDRIKIPDLKSYLDRWASYQI